MKGTLGEIHLKVLRLICEVGEFESRLAEKRDGNIEFLQWGVPDGLVLTERDLIGLLHQLKSAGYIDTTDSVHAGDSAEYVFKWKPTPKGKSIGSTIVSARKER